MICIIPGNKLTDSSDRLLHLSATHLTRTMSMAPKERNNDHNDSEDTKKKTRKTLLMKARIFCLLVSTEIIDKLINMFPAEKYNSFLT